MHLRESDIFREGCALVCVCVCADATGRARQALVDALAEAKCPFPSNKFSSWDHIVSQIGMFAFTGMTPKQCDVLTQKVHPSPLDNYFLHPHRVASLSDLSDERNNSPRRPLLRRHGLWGGLLGWGRSGRGGAADPAARVCAQHHVYCTRNGRFSMAGVNPGNVKYIAAAMKDAIAQNARL